MSLSHLVFRYVSFYGRDSKVQKASNSKWQTSRGKTNTRRCNGNGGSTTPHLETRFNRDFRKYVRRVVTAPLHRVVIVSSGIKWDEPADAPKCDGRGRKKKCGLPGWFESRTHCVCVQEVFESSREEFFSVLPLLEAGGFYLMNVAYNQVEYQIAPFTIRRN